MKRIGIILLSILIASNSIAQEELSLQKAISIALENNYDIHIVAKDLEIANNNVRRGHASMLPSVSGDLSNNNTIQNSTQTQANGDTKTVDNGKSRSLAYGAALDWTIFDGFRMFTRYEQLKTIQDLGEVNLKQEILLTVHDVVSNYYNLVNLKQQTKALLTAIELSVYRHETANNRYQIGQASKLEVLSAKVDLNTDTTNLLRQEDLIHATKVTINKLLARDAQTPFSVPDSILVDQSLQRTELLEAAKKNNPDIKVALINNHLAELQLKDVKGARYPVLTLNSAYTISNSSSALGFATKSNGRGFNYGITASINIFNGFMQRRNEQNAKIEIDQSRLQLEKIDQEIEAQLISSYETYITNMELARLEERNMEIAKQNMEITLEKFKIGTIAPLEYREAQRNFIDASTRYNDSRYQAKLAEIALKQISGTITIR